MPAPCARARGYATAPSRLPALALACAIACSPAAPDSAGSEGAHGSSSGGNVGASTGSDPTGTVPVGTSSSAADTTTGSADDGSDAPPSPDAGPPLPCDSIGDVDAWETITPAGVDATQGVGIAGIALDRLHPGTIFVGTDHQGIWKSTDCGASFEMISTGSGADIIASGTQWNLQIDPDDSNVLYANSFLGSDGSLLKSTDGGVSFGSVWPAGSVPAMVAEYNSVQEIWIDPTDHTHLVATFHADCVGEWAPMCMVESSDAGASWRAFHGPTGGWGEDARPLLLDSERWLYITAQDGVYFTPDRGDAWEQLAPGGGGHQIHRTDDGTFYLCSDYGVYRGPDGHDWTRIDGSPVCDGITGDGDRIFAGALAGPAVAVWTTSDSDGLTWTQMTGEGPADRVRWLMYDDAHAVLYASASTSGLWRLRTH